ncbi:MAG: N-acetylglucosamine-6-phosphate deacetylase [Hyphomicrobiaceae bacterium]|nr:N-acetylglucosamine-6-phosphate deacetylase [Hyphomicrobiaceae bacterium]
MSQLPTIQHAVVADTLFDGARLHHDCAVVIDGPRIAAVLPRREVPFGVPRYGVPEGAWLAPGFIDCQVNGGGDVLFNDAPEPGTIERIAEAHLRYGTTALLPTLITDTPRKMQAAMAGVRKAARTNPGVLGIHLEGPFLSPEKPGVHNPALFRTPSAEDAPALIAGRAGLEAMLVTLAPERTSPGFIRRLTEAGIRVALGHSVATYAETKAALAEGLTGFTHLFNAMAELGSREPGPIAAALEAHNAWFGMIVDGHHVAPAMLRLALRGSARPMLVSDAMPPVGGRKPGFILNGAGIAVRDGRCTRADGTLAGAAIAMADAVRNCVALLGVPLTKALRFASTEPAAFLGLGKALGRVAPGYRADLVAFDPTDIKVCQAWVAGTARGPDALRASSD